MGFLGSSYTHVSEFLLSGVMFEPLLLAFAPLAVLASHPPAPSSMSQALRARPLAWAAGRLAPSAL